MRTGGNYSKFSIAKKLQKKSIIIHNCYRNFVRGRGGKEGLGSCEWLAKNYVKINFKIIIFLDFKTLEFGTVFLDSTKDYSSQADCPRSSSLVPAYGGNAYCFRHLMQLHDLSVKCTKGSRKNSCSFI